MGWGIFGGGESSSSSSTTSTTTTVTNENLGAQEGAIAAKGSTVNVLDAGAISGALDLAGSSLDSAGAAFGTASGLAGRSLDLADRVNDAALDALSKTFKENLDALQQGFTQNVGLTTAALNKTTLDSGERLNSLITALAWITGGVVASIFLIKKFA